MAAGEAALIVTRRKSGFALEQPAKRAEIGIADALADGVDLQAPGLKQPFRDVDAERLQIMQRRLADRLPEAPADGAPAVRKPPRGVGKADAPAQGFLHPVLLARLDRIGMLRLIRHC